MASDQQSSSIVESSTCSSIDSHQSIKLSNILIRGISMISLMIDGKERVCLAQISNTLLKSFSYNEIHNRRVALGINCIQCTPIQLEILRNAGAMPISSRRCGMITRREAERLIKSFLDKNKPPNLPEKFYFDIQHKCGYGCYGTFYPSRYNSSRAKCIQCSTCGIYASPNKFIFHSHKTAPNSVYLQAGTVNFNSWRRHITLVNASNDENLANAWEDVKSIFNSGKRKRMQTSNLKVNEDPFDEDENIDIDDENEELNETGQSSFGKDEEERAEDATVKIDANQYPHISDMPNDMNLINLINPFYTNTLQMLRLFPEIFQKALTNESSSINYLIDRRIASAEFNDANRLFTQRAESNNNGEASVSAFRSMLSTSENPIEVKKKKDFISIIDHLEKN
jgi:hypothetical protein